MSNTNGENNSKASQKWLAPKLVRFIQEVLKDPWKTSKFYVSILLLTGKSDIFVT